MSDISAMMKRGSDVSAGGRTERRRPEPAPEPELEPEPAAEEPEEQPESEQHELMELNLVFDGGSRGNPGQGYGSYLVQSPGRRPVVKRVEFGDNYTNNQAEYDSLIAALEYIVDRLDVTNRSPEQVALDIKTDSDLVVNQLQGTYKVKESGLKPRHARALELLDRFGAWMITWHPREESVRLLGH
jgi:ribonuclease HI